MPELVKESRYASRKWIFCLLLMAVAVGMEIGDKLTPTLADFLKWLGAIYCGFNVTQKASEWVASFISNREKS